MVIQGSSNAKMLMRSVFLYNIWNKSRKSLVVVTMGALLAVGGYASSAFAAKNVNNISGEVTISPSLNVTIPSSTVSLNLNPLNTDFDSSNLNVTISTNNPSGYTLTMSPVVANTTSLTRVSGTETIPTLIEKTGGYTESEFTTNSWGYKLSSTNYLTFKNTNDITTTNTPANNDTSIVTFAAKADNTQAAGTYQLEITFTAIANPLPEPTTTPGKITYNPNSGTVIGEMGDQELTKAKDWSSCYYTDYETYCSNSDWSSVDIDTLPELDYYKDITLYAPNFKNPGYGFAAWNTKADGTGINYGPNETIAISDEIGANGIELYARWIKSQGTFQNWAGCNSLAKGSVTALTDNRDGNTYAVAKLADNKCWMIENLRLDDSAQLTLANTNNPVLPLMNVYDLGIASNHLSPTSSVAYDATTAPEGWCSDFSAKCYDQSRLKTDNTILFVNNTASNYSISGNNGNVYSYGNYYNWYSATAGNGISDIGTNNQSVSGDICPTGWRLPISGYANDSSDNEFVKLDKALGGSGKDSDASTTPTGKEMSKSYRTYPNNFIYSGGAGYSYISNRGENGFYWSSTAHNSNNAYYLYFFTVYVYPTNSSDRSSGKSVRCLINS